VQSHDVFCCLGSTIKKAGSQEAFKKIDLKLVVSVAELMKKQGAEQFLVISALGADKNSKVFYAYSTLSGQSFQSKADSDST
jgi:uncharacterized protein YbjT (DUF2867 family)